MIDYVEFFTDMLNEEDGEEKVSAYLDKIAESVTEAGKRHESVRKRNIAIKKISDVLKDFYGDTPIFTTNEEFGPTEAAEAFIGVLEGMTKAIQGDASGLDELFNWLK